MFCIRPALPSDAPTLLTFIQELADYEKAPHEVTATVADFENTLFTKDSPARALICEQEGCPIGYAVYFFNYSTWQGRRGLYLEDLYVTPAARGKGAGKSMLKQLAAIATEEGCGRFEWSVLDWNTPAIKVYESIGAAPQPQWVRYRLDGQALVDFSQN